VPGYRGQRSGRDSGRQGADQGTSGQPGVGATADGALGKGPVRGFPPQPGQPPPLYPPGQFAAWNRMSAAADAASGSGGQSAQASLPAGARTEAAGSGQPYEPGYSALAVSDPAADVTSTQTWQAITDDPDGPGGGGEWTNPRGTAVDARGAAVQPPVPGPRSGSGRSAPDTAPGPRSHGSRSASRAGAAGSRSGRSPRKRRKSPSVALAVGAVLVVAAAATAFLLNTARHQGAPAAASSPPPTTAPASTPTPTPSATLGAFGHIASRSADPLPVTVAQLFPVRVSIDSASFIRTVSQHGKGCAAAVIGTKLQAAVKAAQCSQVIRASYLSTAEKEMGTIGVLNLGSSKTAAHAGRAAGPANFISQLRAKKGPTHQLGKGTGIEEAETKGHYLILIWAQFTSRHKPKTPAQRKQLEAFMSDLFQQTANVTLSSRMVDGTP
jgi:hypothetical protein